MLTCGLAYIINSFYFALYLEIKSKLCTDIKLLVFSLGVLK